MSVLCVVQRLAWLVLVDAMDTKRAPFTALETGYVSCWQTVDFKSLRLAMEGNGHPG